MFKREIWVILILIGLVGIAIAQNENFNPDEFEDGFDDRIGESNFEDSDVEEDFDEEGNFEDDVNGDFNDFENEEDEIEKYIKDIREAEEFEEELEASAGLTPDSPFYFVDGIFDSREEKAAEMKEMAEKCGEGNEKACDALDVAFEEYKRYANKFEREVSPDEREEAKRSSRAIRGAVARQIAKNVPPGEKDELIREIMKKEAGIETAAEIASQVEELCSKLVELGEIEKAYKVCNLDDEDAPEWLKKRRKEWKGELSESAKEFVGVLKECMRVSDDDILGNTESCECRKMPGKNADLCYKIVKLEDACGAGEEEYCGQSDQYVEEFMEILPGDLRQAFEREFEEFEEDEFERRRPPECEDLDFKECMLKMAESDIRRAPESCQDALREGIRSGEVRGPKDGERICREIMMKEFGASKCVEGNLDPDECAELMSGGFDRRPSGPGVDFVDCEKFESNEEKLECYRHNSGKAEFAGDYYEEKERFRERGEFDEFEFERKFREERKGDYEVHYKEEYRFKYRTEEEAKADFEKRRAEHEKKIESFIRSCEGAWDCSYGDITPDKPCRCYEEKDFSEFKSKEEYKDYFDGNDGQEFSPPEGFEGDFGEFQPPEGFEGGEFGEGFSPPEGFEEFDGEFDGNFDNSGEGSFDSGSSDEGSSDSGSSNEGGSSSEGESGDSGDGGEAPITGGFITGNAFLDYYFGWWN